jgi:tripartite-type tricarboxylate transporter receptor subunit TctC
MIVGTTVLLAQQIKGGTVRGLATTSESRAAILPDVPSAKEAGLKGYDVRTWAGVIAPAGTPAEIVQKLNQAVLDTVQDPAIKPRLETAIGGEARGSTPAEMKQLVSREIVKWKSVVDKANLPRI